MIAKLLGRGYNILTDELEFVTEDDDGRRRVWSTRPSADNALARARTDEQALKALRWHDARLKPNARILRSSRSESSRQLPRAARRSRAS